MVSSGEVGTVGRLQSAVPKLVFSGMAVVGTFLIGQMNFWLVLPGIVLSYGGLIGLSVVGRSRS